MWCMSGLVYALGGFLSRRLSLCGCWMIGVCIVFIDSRGKKNAMKSGHAGAARLWTFQTGDFLTVWGFSEPPVGLGRTSGALTSGALTMSSGSGQEGRWTLTRCCWGGSLTAMPPNPTQKSFSLAVPPTLQRNCVDRGRQNPPTKPGVGFKKVKSLWKLEKGM